MLIAVHDMRPPALIRRLGSLSLATRLHQTESRPAFDALRRCTPSSSSSLLFLMVDEGAACVGSGRVACRIEAGEAALFSCVQPLDLSADPACRLSLVLIPRILLEARLRNARSYLGKAVRPGEAPWRITTTVLETLSREARHVPAGLAHSYASHLIELVTLVFDHEAAQDPDAQATGNLYGRCLSYIQSHASDNSLCPRTIAEGMGISVRYLHKVFNDAGESVCGFLRKARLDMARKELASPQMAKLHVREIAFRSGFKSQAHFASAFKERFDISATAWRKRAIRELAMDRTESAA